MVIRIGIIGFAHGHVDAYCDAWRRMFPDDVQVVAGWDHDPQRAAKAAERHQVRIAGTVDELLAGDPPDAVVVAAETSMHADLVERAARAGCAVVLQKPTALTLDEADRIVRVVTETGIPFTLAWQMRVDPQNLEMRRMVTSGELGRVFMARRRHGLSTHTWPGFDQTWHVRPALNRGMWADDAAHAIDWLLWTLGKPASVFAEIGTLHNPKVPDDNGVAVFRYADGAMAEICCSFTCLAGENTTEVVCERGVIVQNFGDAPSCNAPRPPGAVGLKWLMNGDKEWQVSDIPSPAGHGERIAALAPELLRFLKGERPPICSAEDGRTSLAMTLACYESARTGQRVQL